MHRLCRCFLVILPVALLAGCAVISVADVAVLALSFPGPVPEGTVKLSGYSLGPMSSEETTELLLEAIPPDEGTIHFTGRVEWTGLSKLNQSFGELHQAMSAITDFNILLLWWSESNEQYEVLIRLPFTDIYSIELWTPGFGAAIRFCLAKDEISVGDKILDIDRKSTLRVMKPSLFIDAEKTEELFVLLDTQFIRKTATQGQPNPCDVVPADSEDSPVGFGNCDPAVEEC